MEYFNLPDNHISVIEDAVKYAARIAEDAKQKFDYIVHDVFTGGAEPVDLFTTEFFQDLHSLLKPNGAIAIVSHNLRLKCGSDTNQITQNYAGDLLLPSARFVVRTIKSTFPTCRVFRENAPPDATTLATEGRDFTNLVVFCTKQDANALTFRKPVEADYLGSNARKMFLMPQHEIDEDVFGDKGGEKEEEGGVLSKNNTMRMTRWQRKSAVGHWRLMRTVLPSEVWETW